MTITSFHSGFKDLTPISSGTCGGALQQLGHLLGAGAERAQGEEHRAGVLTVTEAVGSGCC